ncbi:Ku protein [Nocardia cyriacigeorgica]|uniref:non-homologous end joining protein Ku n=1 Tax=Nocardia cyriacigeorgica TaxID=135487 RepID=UPI0018939261|nr:Ku protein [Nocardia cyriacigeorgica]MBF6090006.1 Ku protein [Nocardia cyriacigeorgica]MBF6096057.1 Ku protein [Nocardia cyriacigeorgica]MBF6100432.1 Ku protein [Nocardia cyriacigeorgica]MBF6162031.1 Ku protein [Nocardia cyriacigeorgica]MBF6200907.1 Ku protein [Nocardia cyriacigeorgica]
MRSIWKGSIAFGLVNVPVKVYTATEDHDIRFHQVHAKDGGRIKYDRVCTVCGKSVQYADIDKAYESPDGDKVILTDEDFAKLPVAEKHEIPVLQFVPSDQIDPILFDKTYYLEPDSNTPKAYVLLAATLERIERTALVHFTLRQKTRLAALRVRDGMLVLQTLLWPDEVRSVSFESLENATKPRPQEIKMAETLVDSMSEDFDPSEFKDEYQIELKRVLDEAIASGTGKVPEQPEAEPVAQDAEVVDLVAALQRSLEASGRRAEDGKKRSAPAKKTAAKKTASKRTPAKKSTAKKTATRKGA